jgi:hypothetical protein
MVYDLRPRRLTAWLLPAVLLLCPAVAFATGSVCGTVTNQLTTAPVEGVGVFVRQTTGQYTGYSGATDVTGHYCVTGIPAGTYDLEFRRDNYQVAYRRNVVVTNDAAGVDVEAGFLRSSIDPPAPNPARGRVSFALRIRDQGPISVAVFDLSGRMVKGWTGLAGAGEQRTLTWDFRDAAGRRVPAGRYVVRLSARDLAMTRSFICLP